MRRKFHQRIVDRYTCWKARDDAVQRLSAQTISGGPESPTEAGAAFLAKLKTRRDRLKPPQPWKTWEELAADLKRSGQL